MGETFHVKSPIRRYLIRIPSDVKLHEQALQTRLALMQTLGDTEHTGGQSEKWRSAPSFSALAVASARCLVRGGGEYRCR